MGSSRQILVAISVFLALFVAVLPFNDLVSARQNDETLDTALTGQELRVTGPNYALDDVALEEYPHGQGERVYISSVNTRSFAEVAFFDDADSPEQTISVMMSDFEATSQQFSIVDSGNSDGIYYSLATFQLSDELSGYFYIEVAEDVNGNIDLAQSLYAINEDFAEQLAIASDEISLGGNAFLGVTAIDIPLVIAEYEEVIASTPEATPGPQDYSFEWTDSVVKVQPPLSLDRDSQNDVLESVFISSDVAFAYVGYLNLPGVTPESALESVFEGAPSGQSAPVLLHSEMSGERIWAVYRIAIDGEVTIMVIEMHATSGDLWQVEALAAPEKELLTQVDIFQQAVTIDGAGFLDSLSVDQLELILNSNRP